MEDLRKIIGKNLADLRKRHGLTQLELAEKFNYTDRAVSKWENGDTLPDVEVLYNLCEYYGVTIDFLTHEENSQYIKEDSRLSISNKVTIIALVSSIVWAIATIIFVFSLIRDNIPTLWQSFIWAVPVNAFVVVLFNKLYFRYRLLYFVAWSVFVWGLLTAIYVSKLDYNLWPIFILGVPSQATLVIWLNLKITKTS